MSPCEEASAGWDSLRVEARLVEEEGFKRCRCLCNLLDENGVDTLEEQLAWVPQPWDPRI